MSNTFEDVVFIGAWNGDCGVDIFYEALYLIPGDEQDSLETLPDYSDRSRIMSIPHWGSEREAAT
jgi:hypothetical protein